MKIKIDFEKLNDIMRAFYSVSGIKIIIFDTNRNVIQSYPKSDCSFCSLMKSTAIGNAKCAKNDTAFFDECRKSEKLMLYTCHAGLVEGCIPIKYKDVVIAYAMFGQISDFPSRSVLEQNICDVCNEYGLDKDSFLKAARSIELKKYDDIMSAAKIFEACISYIILKEMLISDQNETIEPILKYINDNLASVTVNTLCDNLYLSRTSLYELFRKRLGVGVSEYIRTKRFERATHLLSESTMSVKDISDACGFSDYNYFSRIYKRKYGVAPRIIKKYTENEALSRSAEKI